MKTEEFDFNLPKELIAQTPAKPRDHSRLLILDKKTGKIKHRHFYEIVEYFQKGDVLVFNNSKVLKARLIGKKKESGGKVEIFLLPSPPSPLPSADGRGVASRASRGEGKRGEVWQCLTKGIKGKIGMEIIFPSQLVGRILNNNMDGTWQVEFNLSGEKFLKVVDKIGQMPLPPYIKRLDSQAACLRQGYGKQARQLDKQNYQTVYADEKKQGSVAAPTAGLHFTKSILNKLKKKGVQIEYVTLHVGLGTFAPVKVDDITKHKMHGEWVEVNKATIARLYLAKHHNRRIITVGTTSSRSLEAIATEFPISNFQFPNNFQFSMTKFTKQFNDFMDNVNIFIYPGYEFKIIDGMITNFHLPKSTLIMLVSALAGKKNIDRAYAEAIKKKYRFYSYGDAMLIM